MTIIPFYLERDTQARLTMYRINGEPIKTLLDELCRSGEHDVTVTTRSLSPGNYYYTLSTADSNQTRKMIVVR